MGDLEKQIERQIDPGVIANRINIKAENAQATQVLVEDERASLENSAKREIIADIVAARAQRESYARRTFKVVVVWISLVYLLLLAQAIVPARFSVLSATSCSSFFSRQLLQTLSACSS